MDIDQIDQAVFNKKLDQPSWLKVFNTEFLRRTGITFKDGGGTDEQALRYWPRNSPLDAVLHQIEKYELVDMTDPWML